MICYNQTYQKLVIFRLACCRSLIIQKIEAQPSKLHQNVYCISVTADRGSQSHYQYNSQ